jgi:two-component system response regulator NreC
MLGRDSITTNDDVRVPEGSPQHRVLAIIPSSMLREVFRAAPLTGTDIAVAMFEDYGPDAHAAFDHAPTVVIVSSFLRSVDAFASTVRTVRAQLPKVPIIAVCPFRDREEVLGAIELGVAGCVSAEASFDKVIEAIRTVQYRAYLCPSVSALLRQPWTGMLPERPLGDAPALTPRERQILRMIANGSTDREVAKLFTLSVRTVNTHRANIMAKLGVRNATQLVRRASQLGLLDNDRN